MFSTSHTKLLPFTKMPPILEADALKDDFELPLSAFNSPIYPTLFSKELLPVQEGNEKRYYVTKCLLCDLTFAKRH